MRAMPSVKAPPTTAGTGGDESVLRDRNELSPVETIPGEVVTSEAAALGSEYRAP